MNFVLQTKLWTDVCKTLLLDVVASEAHQSDRSYMYVSELTRPTFNSLRKNLARWAVTQITSKTHNWRVEVCTRGGTCTGGGCLHGTIQYVLFSPFYSSTLTPWALQCTTHRPLQGRSCSPTELRKLLSSLPQTQINIVKLSYTTIHKVDVLQWVTPL